MVEIVIRIILSVIGIACIACWVMVAIAAFRKEKEPLKGILCVIPCVPFAYFMGWANHEKWRVYNLMLAWTALMGMGLVFSLILAVVNVQQAQKNKYAKNINGNLNRNKQVAIAPNQQPQNPMAEQWAKERQQRRDDREAARREREKEFRKRAEDSERRFEEAKEKFANSDFPKRTGTEPESDENSEPRMQSNSNRAKELHRRRFGSTRGDIQKFSPFDEGILADHPPAEIELPRITYRADKVNGSKLLGSSMKGSRFTEKAPEGGVLVGFNVGVDESGLMTKLTGLQAIYQVGSEIHAGKYYGVPEGDSVLLQAKENHVVTALAITGGIDINSIQLQFSAIDSETGKIDVNDYYLSDTVGKVRGREKIVDSAGWHTMGVFGRADEELNGIGLWAVEGRAIRSDTEEFRTWTSAGGKFTFEGKVKRADSEEVVLVDKKGKSRTVPVAKLSEKDQKWLKENLSATK